MAKKQGYSLSKEWEWYEGEKGAYQVWEKNGMVFIYLRFDAYSPNFVECNTLAKMHTHKYHKR